MATITPQAFVSKWRSVALKERAAVQEHFLDLCALVGHPTPAEDDPTGERFTFEAGVAKLGGGQGFFAWRSTWNERGSPSAWVGRLMRFSRVNSLPIQEQGAIVQV